MSPRRTRLALTVGLLALVGVAVALALFQPWKLFVDEEVQEAAPVGAVAIVASPSADTTAAPAPVTTPAPAPVTTPAPSPADPTTAAPATTAGPATTAPPEPPTSTAAPPPPAPAATSFISIDHTTTGMVVLLADADGRRYVRFEDLATDNGPDLKVYLSTNTFDGPEGAFDDDFVDLGRLQGNLGSQNYEIPADVDLSRYRSVVIWCDRFNSAFGAAALP
jgi:hypothetical protein